MGICADLLLASSVVSASITDSVADDCRVGEPECQKRVTRVDPDVVENRRCVKCER